LRAVPEAVPAPCDPGLLPCDLGPISNYPAGHLARHVATIVNAALPGRYWSGRGGLLRYDANGGALVPVSATDAWATANALVTFSAGAPPNQTHRPLPREYGPMVVAHAPSLFPPLQTVRAAPFLLPDGRMAVEAGYYRGAGILLHYPDGRVPIVPGPRPGCAKEILRALLGEFEWDGWFPLIGALAMLVEPLLVTWIAGPKPLYLIRAANQRAGKSTLGRLPGLLALGRRPEHHGLPQNAIELPFSLAASLARLQSMLFLDNVPDGWLISSPELERLLTATGLVPMRPARSGRNIEVDPTLATFVLTGNRVTVTGGMKRRVVPIELRAQPAGRRYAHPDYDAWVLAERPAILGALVWAIDEWVRQGCPEPERRYDSFPRWSHAVGGVVAVLYDEIHATGNGRAAVSEWFRQLGEQPSPEDNDWRVLFAAWTKETEILGGVAAGWSAAKFLEVADALELPFVRERVGTGNEKSRVIKMGDYLATLARDLNVVGGIAITRLQSGKNSFYRLAMVAEVQTPSR
jgi:hypothetical protein